MVPAEIERLAERVRAAARDDGFIETAQVKLVGLDEVREAAGKRWPRMRAHVRETSIKIIAQRIGPDDAVIPCGDGFLVVFADTGIEKTQAKCREIRDALTAFYLGEDALKALHADVQREAASAASLAGLVADTTAAAPKPTRRNDLKLGRFWPIWSSRRQSIAAHLCAPVIEVTGAPARLGYTPGFIDKPSHDGCDFLDLDLCLLEQAFEAAESDTAAVGVTVHASTLQRRKSRNIYLEHVAANSSSAQQRMFILISEVVPGTPLISLTEWTNALRRTFPRVALDLHHSDRAIGALASAGVWAAGYHLPTAPCGSRAQLRGALNELDTWCRALRRQGIQPLVNGFNEGAFLDLATCSDLAFASGERLWPSRKAPGAVARLSQTHVADGAVAA